MKSWSMQTIFYIILLIAIAVLGTYLVSDKHALQAISSATATPVNRSEIRQGLFEIKNYRTATENRQTINLTIHYQYSIENSDSDIPNHQDLRTAVVAYLDRVNSDNSYLTGDATWDSISKSVCDELDSAYKLDAISCRVDVPGSYSAITTVGELVPLHF